MPKYKVLLVFRRLRDAGNFSIEASFDRMISSFPSDSAFCLESIATSFLSNGIAPRLRGVLEVRRYKKDINHITGDVHYLVFAFPRKNVILTVHDCGFMKHPNRVARWFLKWLWLDLPVAYCRYVTAVSEATKREIVRYTGCDPAKIIVIPTIISEIFKRDDRIFNDTFPRILHIGLAPNKNFERHVAAISGLDCHLHVIGRLRQDHIDLLTKHKLQYSHEHNISVEEMQRAYAQSDLLLFASTLEGFGMPILEAQTVGRPVVTSNVSSMPEVGGNGACYVDPLDIGSIRAGIEKVIRDRVYREELVSKGYENAKCYSASAVARQYEQLYSRVVNEYS